jgi:thiamine-phosphate pyrophosphorylase
MAGAPRCRIYLRVPALDAGAARELLGEAVADRHVECVLFTASAAEAFGLDLVRELIAFSRAHGTVALLEDDVSAAERFGADGVHLSAPDPQTIAGTRGRLGERAVIGAFAGLSRHAGMEFAEAGADYVAIGGAVSLQNGDHEIGQIKDMVRWWSELIEVPCVARVVGGWDAAEDIARAGADFIDVDALIWSDDTGPRDAIKRLHELLQGK